jgi:hypothetical protein
VEIALNIRNEKQNIILLLTKMGISSNWQMYYIARISLNTHHIKNTWNKSVDLQNYILCYANLTYDRSFSEKKKKKKRWYD